MKKHRNSQKGNMLPLCKNLHTDFHNGVFTSLRIPIQSSLFRSKRISRFSRQKRIIFEDACYFVTSKTYNNYPYFKERIFCELFVENLKLCKQLKGFLLYGWVLAYDHFHLLIQPSNKYDISKVMQFLKRNISRGINFIIGFNEYDEQTYPIPEGDNDHCRLQRTLGIQRFVKIKFVLKIRFKIKYINQNSYPQFKWQRSFNDHYIRNDWDFDDKMDYISWNPEKHGLPSDWQYVYTNPNYEDLISM